MGVFVVFCFGDAVFGASVCQREEVPCAICVFHSFEASICAVLTSMCVCGVTFPGTFAILYFDVAWCFY